MTLRGMSWRLFLTVWVICGLHFATNTVREIYPALSLGDHLSFDVSDYAGLHPDIFEMPGRGWFINNNPGASIVGAVPYALARPLIDRVVQRVLNQRKARGQTEPPPFDSPWPMAREFYRKSFERGYDIKFGFAAGVMQAGAMAPLTALAAVVMFRLLAARGIAPTTAACLALLYVVATPVLFRAGQLNQNLLVAHCALFSFALLGDSVTPPPIWSFLFAGLLAGWAVVCDYSGLVVVAALSFYVMLQWANAPVTRRRMGGPAGFVLGVAMGGAVLAAYQWSCFGHPLYPAQHYMPAANFTEQGYQGFSLPQPDLLWDTAFSLRFGLFTSAPFLLLALWVPAWRKDRRILQRPEFLLALGCCLGLFIFCAANQYGRMQFNTGVRHVLPAVPFLFLLAASTWRSIPRAPAVLFAAAGTYVSWCLAMYRDVEQGAWGLLDVIKNITLGGPQLPWVTTLSRMHGFITLPASPQVISMVILATAALGLAALWLFKGSQRHLLQPAANPG